MTLPNFGTNPELNIHRRFQEKRNKPPSEGQDFWQQEDFAQTVAPPQPASPVDFTPTDWNYYAHTPVYFDRENGAFTRDATPYRVNFDPVGGFPTLDPNAGIPMIGMNMQLLKSTPDQHFPFLEEQAKLWDDAYEDWQKEQVYNQFKWYEAHPDYAAAQTIQYNPITGQPYRDLTLVTTARDKYLGQENIRARAEAATELEEVKRRLDEMFTERGVGFGSFGQFAQAPNVGFGQSEVLPQEFYDLRNRKAELEDIIAGVNQLEDTLAETLPDSPIIVGPDGRYLPMDLDPNKDWVFSRAFLRANQDIMNNNPLARFGWNIGSAVLLGIWDILKAGGRALTAPIGYAIEVRNRRKDGYEDVLDRSVWDLMRNGSDSIPTLNAYMYDLQHPDSVEFVRRFVVAEESMRLLAEVFDKKVGLIPGEVEELSLAGTPYAANQLAILKDLGESLGFEVTPEDLDIVSPEELGVLFGQISEKTKAQQQQDIASYNKISDRKKAIIAELSALKQQYFSDYEMDEMSYWEQTEKYREELTSLERELWSLSRTSPFVSDMTYTYTESMQLLNNPATGENDQEKYMLGVTQALADAQLQMDEMLSPEQREGIAKNWSDPEAEFLGQFVFDAFNAVPGELFADVLKGVFKGAKWAAFKVPGVKAGVDWIGQQALSAMASRMARWASPDLQGIARAVTHMEGPDGFYSVLRKLLGGQLNVKDLGKYRLTVRSVENWTKILTLLGKGSDAGVLAVDEFMDLVNLVQRGAQTELLMKYGNMTIDELAEASGMILMSRGDKQRAIDFLVARALNDPNTHIPGILEAIRTTYRKLPVNRAFAGGPFSDTVLGQLSKLVKLDLPEKELANWQKNSKRFIRWWMTLNYHAKKIWSSLVLTARPAFTVFNYTDSAFRALMHGARLFDDIGDIYKMAPVWVEDIPGAFMQVGGGTPGELDIAHMVIEKARQGQRYKLIDIMRDAMRLEGHKPWTPAGWMAAVNALNSAFETSFRMRLYAPRFAKEWKLATILMENVLESKGYFDDAYVRQVYDFLIQTSNGKPEVMADLIEQIVSGEVRPGAPYGITLPEGLFEEVASRMGRSRAEVFLRSIQQELLNRLVADGELTDDAVREVMERARKGIANKEYDNLVQRPREIDADGALNMSPDPDSNSMAMYDEMTDGQIEKQLDEALENRTTPHAEDVNTSQMNKIDPRAPTVRSLDRIVQEAQAAAPKAEALADVPSWTGSSRSGHVFSRGDNDPHALMIVAEVQERGATEYKIFNAAGDDITREVSKTKRAYYGGLNNEVKPAVQKYYDSLVEAADSFSRGEIKVRANLADEVDAGIINVRGTKFMYTAEYGDKTFVRLMDSNGNTWYAPIEQFPDTVKWEKYTNLDDLINPPPTPGLGGAKKPDWNKELAAIQREMKGYSVADFRNKLSQYHKVGHSSEFLNPDSPNAIVKRLKSGEKTMEQETWDLIVGWYDELQSSQKGHAHAVELGVRSPDIPIIPSRKKVIKFSSLQDPYQTFYELLAISDELQSSTFKVQRIGEGAVELGDEALAAGIVEKAGRKPTMFNEEAMIVTYAMEDLESLRKGMKIVVPDEKVFDRKKAEALLLQWEKERIADAIAQGTKVIDEETITVKKKRLEKIKKDKKLSDVEAQKQAIYEATSNRRVKPKKIVKPTEEAIENTEQLKKSAPKAKRTPRDVASEAVDELRKQKLAAETAVAKDFDPNDIKIGTRIKSTKGTRAIVLERIELEEGVVNSYIVQDEAGKIREIQPGSISSVHGQATADQLTKIKVPDEVADIEEPDMEDLVGITFEIDPQVDIDLARQFEIEFYDAFEGQAYKERMSLAEVIQRRQELVSDAMKDEIKYERWLTTAQSRELAEAGIGSDRVKRARRTIEVYEDELARLDEVLTHAFKDLPQTPEVADQLARIWAGADHVPPPSRTIGAGAQLYEVIDGPHTGRAARVVESLGDDTFRIEFLEPKAGLPDFAEVPGDWLDLPLDLSVVPERYPVRDEAGKLIGYKWEGGALDNWEIKKLDRSKFQVVSPDGANYGEVQRSLKKAQDLVDRGSQLAPEQWATAEIALDKAGLEAEIAEKVAQGEEATKAQQEKLARFERQMAEAEGKGEEWLAERLAAPPEDDLIKKIYSEQGLDRELELAELVLDEADAVQLENWLQSQVGERHKLVDFGELRRLYKGTSAEEGLSALSKAQRKFFEGRRDILKTVMKAQGERQAYLTAHLHQAVDLLKKGALPDVPEEVLRWLDWMLVHEDAIARSAGFHGFLFDFENGYHARFWRRGGNAVELARATEMWIESRIMFYNATISRYEEIYKLLEAGNWDQLAKMAEDITSYPSIQSVWEQAGWKFLYENGELKGMRHISDSFMVNNDWYVTDTKIIDNFLDRVHAANEYDMVRPWEYYYNSKDPMMKSLMAQSNAKAIDEGASFPLRAPAAIQEANEELLKIKQGAGSQSYQEWLRSKGFATADPKTLLPVVPIEEQDAAWEAILHQGHSAGPKGEAYREASLRALYGQAEDGRLDNYGNFIEWIDKEIAAAFKKGNTERADLLYWRKKMVQQDYANALAVRGLGRRPYPLPTDSMIPRPVLRWIREGQSVVDGADYANGVIDQIEGYLTGPNKPSALLTREGVTSETEKTLRLLKDDITTLQAEGLEAVNYGGNFLGQNFDGVVPFVNRAMLDYQSYTPIDQFLKQPFLIPFWMFPSRSLTMWSRFMVEHPEMAGFYSKYLEYSEAKAKEAGLIDSRGGALPSTVGYVPLGLGSELWFNPLAPLSFRYALSPMHQSRRYDIDWEDMDPLEAVVTHVMNNGRIWGFNPSPFLTGILYKGEFIDENVVPQYAIVPQISLIPNWTQRSIANWLRHLAPGIMKDKELLQPEVGFQDYLIDFYILTHGFDLAMRGEGNAVDIAEMTANALKWRDRRKPDGSFYNQRGQEFYAEMLRNMDESDYYRTLAGYFTGVYTKQFTTAQAQFNLLKTDINSLKAGMNDMAAAVIMDLDPTAAGRRQFWRHNRYEIPEGYFYTLYNILRYEEPAETIVDPSRGDYKYAISQAIAEEQADRWFYSALDGARQRLEDGLYEEIGNTRQMEDEEYAKYKKSREDIDELRYVKYGQEWGEIDTAEVFSAASRPWNSGYLHPRLMWENIEAEWWSFAFSTYPTYNEKEENWEEYQLRVDRWWEYEVPLLLKASSEIWDTYDKIQWLVPELVVTEIPGRLLQIANREGHDAYRRRNHNVLQASDWVWENIYRQEWWEDVGTKSGEERTLAERAFKEKYANGRAMSVGGDIGPDIDWIIEQVTKEYGDRFNDAEIREALMGKEIWSMTQNLDRGAQEDFIAEGWSEEKAKELQAMESELYDVRAAVPPAGMDDFKNRAIRIAGPGFDQGLIEAFAAGDIDRLSEEEMAALLPIIQQTAKALGQPDIDNVSNMELKRRSIAKKENDQFRAWADSQTYPGFMDERQMFYSLSPSAQSAYLKENPRFKEALDKYGDLKDEWGSTHPTWASYYATDSSKSSSSSGRGGGRSYTSSGPASGGSGGMNRSDLRLGRRVTWDVRELVKKPHMMGRGGAGPTLVWPKKLAAAAGPDLVEAINSGFSITPAMSRLLESLKKVENGKYEEFINEVKSRKEMQAAVGTGIQEF